MEQRVYSLICKYGPISSNVIARLYNVSGNKITNEIVNKAEPVDIDLVENCIKKLLKSKEYRIQVAPGEPKRYISSNMSLRQEDIEEDEEEYYEMEEEYDEPQLEEDNYFLPTNDMKSQYAMSNVRDTHLN